MTIAFVNSVLKQGTSSGTGNSAATDMTGADLIVIIQTLNDTVTTRPPADNLGNTYTLAVKHVRSDGANVETGLWYSKPSSVSNTMQFSSNYINFDAISVAGYSGTAAASVLDATNSNALNATSLPTNAVTITAGELVVFGMGRSWNATITATPGTVRQQAPLIGGTSWATGIGDIIGGSAGSQSSTWSTSGGSAAAEAVIASFKAAAGGGGGGKLFTPSNMDGIGSGGPFFSDRLAA